jgi:hypothetical protein
MCALLEDHHVRLWTLADLVAGAARARLETNHPGDAKEAGTMARAHSRSERCSFCGRAEDQVHRIISGPGVRICSECVDLRNEVLARGGPRPEPPAPSAPRRRTRPDLPLVFRTWLRNLFRVTAPGAG